jgi:hypothetical protein
MVDRSFFGPQYPEAFAVQGSPTTQSLCHAPLHLTENIQHTFACSKMRIQESSKAIKMMQSLHMHRKQVEAA